MKIIIEDNEYVIYKEGREIASFDLDYSDFIYTLANEFDTTPIFSDVDQD